MAGGIEKVGTAIMGGGLTELLLAYFLRQQGENVAIFDPQSSGALRERSLRTGVYWPTGLSPALLELVKRSVHLWRFLARSDGFPIWETGALQLAFNEEEFHLLEELLLRQAPIGDPPQLLTPEDILNVRPGLRVVGMEGAFFEPKALNLDPFEILLQLQRRLTDIGVEFYYQSVLQHLDAPAFSTADGKAYVADRLVFTSTEWMERFFPTSFKQLDLLCQDAIQYRILPQHLPLKPGPSLAVGFQATWQPALQLCDCLALIQRRYVRMHQEGGRHPLYLRMAQSPRNGLYILQQLNPNERSAERQEEALRRFLKKYAYLKEVYFFEQESWKARFRPDHLPVLTPVNQSTWFLYGMGFNELALAPATAEQAVKRLLSGTRQEPSQGAR